MIPTLSPNAQAILLLTAPLLAGRGASGPDLLTPGEYKRLARHLREIQRQPSDLASPDAEELLRGCRQLIDAERLRRLLGRGFLLSQVVERWQARAIWVVSRADNDYPRRLKARLREDAPAVLYGCGEIGRLETGGLAVVGSRHVDDALVDYTLSIGRLAARANKTLVSGGARGIDHAAMQGALEAGGNACGVLADSLEKTSMNREHRNQLLQGRLTLISPYDPSAGFNVGNAMQRNKLIYALADASLVVSSDVGKGGTWAGAVEQLDKLRNVAVYVRSTGEPSAGLEALRKKGALAWPNPVDTDSLEAVFRASPSVSEVPAQTSLGLFAGHRVAGGNVAAADHLAPAAGSRPGDEPAVLRPEPVMSKLDVSSAEALSPAVRETILQLLVVPRKDAEVAAALKVPPAQAKAWLRRLLDEGMLEKRKKPAGYVVKQKRLFG